MPDAPPSSPIEPFRPLPDPSWRERIETLAERLRSLGRTPRAVLAAAVTAGVIAVAAVLLLPSTADPAPEESLPRADASAAPASAAPAATTPLVVVQAAGAVVHPGLYRLAPGARVDDLVHAAGGLAPDADPDRVNLAAPLVDGEKIYIPRVGEPTPSDATSGGAASGPTRSQPIDLNTASIGQLDALPGIGPATAQAIVDYRAQHGRYRSVDDLLNVRGIGPAKLDQIRSLVRV
ncbi:MAG: competence protein ComEA [Acidimicrobiaceae bacterium]